ncbi:hypothetical protein TEA_015449 [Camellia sinensis var. sinensis]|uniref:Ribosome-recycling factor, chloroplastic n=1 Tax=Camellia sinensis var. sinensis TaxID=542762 RepID=A0A4S4EPY1_CAMSN|nr:hypothetical protein TEA_015449 [Camellia sinensis var. sinensis]
MAMSFSPATPVRTIYHHTNTNKPNPPKTLLSLRDTNPRGPDCAKCNSTFRNAISWSSAANYVTLYAGARRFAGKPHSVKELSERRQVDCLAFGSLTGIFRCATIEEIEAEKYLIEKSVKEKMEKTIETVRSNFNSIRTGRANPSMLDRVEMLKSVIGSMHNSDVDGVTKEDGDTLGHIVGGVEYYGTPVSLKSIAQISTPEASSLLVQPYDKSSLKAIEKAIVSSDLGFTPNNDGEVIRLSLPQLTSERRKELLKVVSKQVEEGKEKKLSEDNVKDLSSDLQKMIDEYMKKIDSIYKQKEKVLSASTNPMTLDKAI